MGPPRAKNVMADNHPRRRVMAVISEYALISSEIKLIVLATYAPARADVRCECLSPHRHERTCAGDAITHRVTLSHIHPA
jgi:hypothetical protein